METKYDKIFPTLIMTAGDVLPKRDIDNINKDIKNLSIKNINGPTQSHPLQHENPVYSSLCDRVIELCEKYMTDSSYLYEKLEITNMWSNIIGLGQYHAPHTHSNNILSGVYYPQSDNNAKIHFLDPRPQAGVLTPKIKYNTTNNSNLLQYPSETNQMIIFPSWLQHYVESSTSGEPRHSVAWNVMMRGLVGDPHKLQSATF